MASEGLGRVCWRVRLHDNPLIAGGVAAHYQSMAEVAGDFYDFVVTPSGQLGVLVADVSGHGVPAALVASMVKIALAVQEREIEDPGLVLTRMNRPLEAMVNSSAIDNLERR